MLVRIKINEKYAFYHPKECGRLSQPRHIGAALYNII